MIEDDELRALFQVESEERLSHLEEAVSDWESDPQNNEILSEILRDFHTLKGTARMLNVQSIETISHHAEDSIRACKQGLVALGPSIFQALLECINGIRLLVDEAVTGIASSVRIPEILKKLNFPIEAAPIQAAVGEGPHEEATVFESSEMSEEPIKEEIYLQTRPAEPPKSKGWERPRVTATTIRIDTQQINELIAESAVLTVTKNRIGLIFERIEELLTRWERKSREYKFLPQYQGHPLSLGNFSKESDANIKQELITFFWQMGESLRSLRSDAYEDTRRLNMVSLSFVDRIHKLHLVPISKLFELFTKMVYDLSLSLNKRVNLITEGGEITVDKKIVEEMKDPLMHILRNAVSHGIELPVERERQSKPTTGLIQLIARQTANTIVIEVADDGRGLNTDRIKERALTSQLISYDELESIKPSEIHELIFLHGFTTTADINDLSGRGIGLDIAKTKIERLNGTLSVESEPGKGCRFFIQIPATYVTTHALIIQAGKERYAIPIDLVDFCILIKREQITTIKGYEVITINGEHLSIFSPQQLLGLYNDETNSLENSENVSCLVLKCPGKKMALLIDAILEEQMVIVTPPHSFLEEIHGFTGTTILKTGEVCVVLNPFELIETIESKTVSFKAKQLEMRKKSLAEMRKTLLFIEDSATLKLILKRKLEESGYHVITASNGAEGLDLLKNNHVDALVTDIEMPKMDGLTMIGHIRRQPMYATLPIVIFSSLSSQAEKNRAFELGANAFIVKSEYNSQEKLLQNLKGMIK